MKFRSKNLLVSGGAGFIGSNFIEYLLDKYEEIKIYNIDLLTYAGDLRNTIKFSEDSRYKFIKGDICDRKLLDEIFRKYKIDGVINFAAETHVDNSIKNPSVFVKTNIEGVFALLNTCYKYWMKSPQSTYDEFANSRFHQVSTDEVFGSIKKGKFNENSPYLPNSPYSASKASADMLVRSFNKTYFLNTTISISSNNFGKNQNSEKFIPKLINCITNDLYMPVYGTGNNFRDWLFVKDNCTAIDLIFNNGKNGNSYNVGSAKSISNLEIIDRFYSYSKKTKKIKFIEDRFGHDYRYSLNNNKIMNELGWKNTITIFEYFKEKLKTL